MKKILCLLLAVLLLLPALAFTSCDKEKNDDPLTYRYDYDLSEYLTLGQYKGLPAQGYSFSVSDEQLERQILATRAYYSRSIVIQGRGAENLDIVYINYEATVDGEAIEGGSGQNYELTIGTGVFPDDVENALIGTQAGDHLSLDLVAPTPYPSYPELAGRSIHYEIDVLEVREQELPEYSENFVRSYLGYDSIEDFETTLRQKLEDHYKEIYYQSVVSQTWKQVVENTVIKKYPPEVKEMYDELVSSNQAIATAQGVDFATYLMNRYEMTEEEFYQTAQQTAESRIGDEMICYAIARAENLTITDEEYPALATDYAVNYYSLSSLEELESIYDKPTIRQVLLFEKVKKYVADQAAITYLDPIVTEEPEIGIKG